MLACNGSEGRAGAGDLQMMDTIIAVALVLAGAGWPFLLTKQRSA